MANIELTNENREMEFESEDRINFTQIYNSIIRNTEFTPEDFRVYAVICSYTWGNGSWNLTIESLIKETGVKRTTLFSCLNWLEQSGYMQRVERRNDKRERLPNKYVVKKINQDTGLPVGISKIEKRMAAPKSKKTSDNTCGKTVDKVVDNPPKIEKLSSAGELGVVQQANRLKTITKPNTIVNKDYRKKDDSPSSLSFSDIWLKSKIIIKKELTEVEFNTWINPLVAIDVTDDTLKLLAPNNFTLEIVQTRYSDIIARGLKSLGIIPNKIDIVVDSI